MKSGHVFGRHNAADMPAAVAGDGCFIFDQDGNRYLDGSVGAAVSCLGHSDMAVRDAMLARNARVLKAANVAGDASGITRQTKGKGG